MTKKNNLKGMEKARNSSIADEILESLGEFTDALKKGEVNKRFIVRQIRLDLRPTTYGPKLVKATRNSLGISQVLFARFLGVSAKTIQSWEQGLKEPNAMACRFMDEIRRNPDYWVKRLRQAAASTTSV